MHTKSKYVHNGEALWRDESRRQHYVIAALENRRRISTEAMRTRRYLDQIYDTDDQALVVVTGDFNDGPGVDYFETHYLTHSVADILLGSVYYLDRRFDHALIGHIPQDELFTASFDDFVDEIADRPLLLDHVIVSPALSARHEGRIAHAEFAAQTDRSRPADDRDHHASDHRPIVVDIT